MFDRLVERFCEFDDFCNAVRAEWKAMLLSNSKHQIDNMGRKAPIARVLTQPSSLSRRIKDMSLRSGLEANHHETI